MDIQVSTDKIVFEYRDVPIGFFLKWYMRLMLKRHYRIRRVEYRKIYVYQLHIRREHGVYLHVFYRNFRETAGGLYTLRVETRPEHLEIFAVILSEIRKMSSGVDFVSSDVAYDVPAPLERVLVISSDMRRKLRRCKGTRYFGLPHQRKQHGYCRVYDKAQELRERHDIWLEGDLTRIEMVYKPEKRLQLANIAYCPPQHNLNYFASLIPDDMTAKQAERMKSLQTGTDMLTRHIRETIKRTLAEQAIDFDRLASERWQTMMAVPCAVKLAA